MLELQIDFTHVLGNQNKSKLEKKKWPDIRASSTYIDQTNAGALETLDDSRLWRIRNSGFSDESEGRVT